MSMSWFMYNIHHVLTFLVIFPSLQLPIWQFVSCCFHRGRPHYDYRENHHPQSYGQLSLTSTEGRSQAPMLPYLMTTPRSMNWEPGTTAHDGYEQVNFWNMWHILRQSFTRWCFTGYYYDTCLVIPPRWTQPDILYYMHCGGQSHMCAWPNTMRLGVWVERLPSRLHDYHLSRYS